MTTFDPAAISAQFRAAAEEIRSLQGSAAVLGQVQSGDLTVKGAVGVSNLATGQAARAGQSFEIGSQTKMMTAALVLKLVEGGSLDLDAKAADYLPTGTLAGIANAEAVTLRQLLEMRSGIAGYTDVTDASGMNLLVKALLTHPHQPLEADQFLDLLRGVPAKAAPGGDYDYSNTNYVILQKVIEAVTGQDYFTALHDGVTGPLGLQVDWLTARDPDRLHSYVTNPILGTPFDVTHGGWHPGAEGGGATTTDGMIGFLRGLLQGGLLTPDSLAQMEAFQTILTGPQFTAGFGLGLVQLAFGDGHSVMGFDGKTLGTSSASFADLAHDAWASSVGTGEGADVSPFTLWLLDQVRGNADWQTSGAGPVEVVSGTASAARLTGHGATSALTLDLATLTLHHALAELAAGDIAFADGSVVVVGDGTRDTVADGRGNVVDLGARGVSGLILGLGGNDRLTGGAGADQIRGGAGRDRIDGGAGDDQLWGGGGADTFVFRADSGHDRIRDFHSGQDRIDLSAMGLHLVAGAFTHQAGELRITQGAILADLDGDGTADFVLDFGQAQPLAADLIL